MRISLYMALSLDGYIADAAGGVDWLSMVEEPGEDYGYQAFYDSVDALILGSRTYEQILEWGGWPYPGKPAWVLSSRSLPTRAPEVTVTASSPAELLAEMKMTGVNHAWLVGGAETAAPFIHQGRVSHYILSLVPLLLGDGLPLFSTGIGRHALTLVERRSFPSGLVQLCYETTAESET